VPATLDKPVDLLVRHAATFQKSDLDLYFRRVVSDSRCPQGAQCVTAGEAVVTLEGRILKATPQSFEVRLPGGDAPDSIIWTAFEGYRIRLVRLDPVPVAGVVADTNAYVGRFVVEKH
jgi:hypothetical protein